MRSLLDAVALWVKPPVPLLHAFCLLPFAFCLLPFAFCLARSAITASTHDCPEYSYFTRITCN
ncbi:MULTISPECIES: hypothetical protein [unclassified Moorena]|uniref:hypothetical protein n=1 Tax=unclassified Moorena TaxID=2683338 RepID=UPI0025F7EB33|nr:MULTISPECIES: hypothetical protein [unclassified Moorena]